MKKILQNENGLTLIEILISIALMASLFLMMNNTMEDVTWTRNKVLSQSENSHSLYVTFSRVYDDINMAFLADVSFEGQLQPHRTAFIGGQNTLNFSTLSGLHFIQDKADSNAHHVGFFLKPNNENSQSLMRRSTDYLLQDIDSGGQAFEILNRVKSMNFEYYDSNKRAWQSQWDTNQVVYAGRLPQRVKVVLEIYGELKSDDSDEREELTYEWIIPIEMFKTKISF